MASLVSMLFSISGPCVLTSTSSMIVVWVVKKTCGPWGIWLGCYLNPILGSLFAHLLTCVYLSFGVPSDKQNILKFRLLLVYNNNNLNKQLIINFNKSIFQCTLLSLPCRLSSETHLTRA